LGIIATIGGLAALEDTELEDFTYETTNEWAELTGVDDWYYEPLNPIGIFAGLVCNIIYIVMCCKVKSQIDKIHKEAPEDVVNDEQEKLE